MHRPAEVFPPGEYLRDELEAHEWTQGDFAEILGRPPTLVNEVIMGKRSITPETAKGIAAALGTTPEFWMNLQSAYDLWNAGTADVDPVARRARLYGKAPIKDMLRRCWLEPSNSIDVLERQVLRFFEIHTFDEEPRLAIAARKTLPNTAHTIPQLAWFYRAKQLAPAIQAAPYSPSNLEPLLDKLRAIEGEAPAVRHIPRLLSEAGIRFVVIEHLPGTKIDGGSFWVDDAPVVVMSLRYDRIDNLWWVLLHELGHIKHEHTCSLDTELAPAAKDGRPRQEQEADAFASEHILPEDQLEDFINRSSAIFSADRIEGFAKMIGVHPGIVVGQLQGRDEIGYASFRKALVVIRDTLTAAALTDGWGYSISLGKGN